MKYSDTYIEFVIFSDLQMNHNEITNILGVEPKKIANKGDTIRYDLYEKNSYWLYSTKHIDTLDVEEVIEIMLKIINPKIKELSNYLNINKLESKFYIVIHNYTDTFPNYFISRDFIKTCYFLNSEIDTDVYLSPLSEDYHKE